MKKYKLKNLHCASCALKIEEEVNRRGINARVNFSTSELFADADRKTVAEIVKSVEPGVEVLSQNEEDEELLDVRKEVVWIAAAGLLFLAGVASELYIHEVPILEYSVFLAAYLAAGWKILYKAARNITRGTVFDENFLLTVATLGAIAIHELPEAVGVMLFFRIGEFLQDLAVSRSRRSIRSLLAIKPEKANLLVDGRVVEVSPEDVEVGSIIVVKPGERVPLDGVVIDGSTSVDTSALTGESRPRRISVGDEVMSGMVNLQGLIKVRVSRSFSDSTVSRILQLVEDAAGRKAKAEKFITRFARYYTPAVISLAAAVAVIPPLAFSEPLSPWLYRALVLLVIACPCALVLSIPLSYFASIGKAARDGVLIKGANYIDALREARTFAFDKTGTLTEGVFTVTEVVARNGFSRDEVLRFAAMAERYSDHPIAKSILDACGEIDALPARHREIPGRGVEAEVDGFVVVVGNDLLMHEIGVEHVCSISGTTVHVVVNGVYAGYILVSDRPKDDARTAVKELVTMNRRVIMLTGDNSKTAEAIAKQLGIDEFYAELLPEDKVRIVEKLQESGVVAFVGDGINDAPVIARADIGIAMGALGSDAAIEVADVVVMDDKPSKVVKAVKLALRTNSIVWQNIIFALAVKGFFIALGSAGMATMWEAVFADVGVTLIAVLNSMRIFR